MFPDSTLTNVVDVYFKFAQHEIDNLRYLKMLYLRKGENRSSSYELKSLIHVINILNNKTTK